jgi:chromosome segregation protein
VDIVARPTSKRVRSLSQLSGGEKALTAVSFLFALLQTNPSPFCVLDEVDAMLDEANVGRFVGALQQLSERTQFIVISHNRKTIEKADSIYGVSMGPDNVSKVLSLRLSEVSNN